MPDTPTTASPTNTRRTTASQPIASQADYTFRESWQRALDLLCERVYSIRKAVGDAWPYHYDPVTGVHDTVTDGDWCGGHWVESLRIVGELTGDRTLELESAERTERLRPYLERYLPTREMHTPVADVPPKLQVQ